MNLTQSVLVAEFISPQKVYTFSFILGTIIPKSVKCIHSATKYSKIIPIRFINLPPGMLLYYDFVGQC